MIVSFARQLCFGIHKVQEERPRNTWRITIGTNVGSAVGMIIGLLPGTEKDGEDL
jgi:hypothetical protein